MDINGNVPQVSLKRRSKNSKTGTTELKPHLNELKRLSARKSQIMVLQIANSSSS
jgi:hypothetical protein